MDTESKKKSIIKYLLDSRILPQASWLQALGSPEHVELLYSQAAAGVPALQLLQQAPAGPAPFRVRVLFDYKDKPRKLSPQDFVQYFNARYRAIECLLQQRQELQNLTSLARLQNKKDRETVSVIGIVSSKQATKNENIMLVIEDPTGSIKVMVKKDRTDAYAAAKDIVNDEVIGLSGTTGSNIIFANSITIPDIPVTTELKKSADEAYVAVLSCTHVGSKLFLADAFDRFVRWLNGETGSEKQRAIAQKVKYVIIAGDIVDGVGIYPGQEKELAIDDIGRQYDEAARLFSRIPASMAIIIIPGNHDAGRISEPQQPLSRLYAKALYSLPNAFLFGNPCLINLHASDSFPGFDFLIYHGFSFDDYGEIVPSIKSSGRNISDRAPLIMKFLLQRRHLAPAHTSTLYIPDREKDPLVIEQVPDFFVAGHIHKSNAASYRGVGIVCGSCFQAKTPLQEKLGHEPDPGRVPLINLQTRQVTIMRF